MGHLTVILLQNLEWVAEETRTKWVRCPAMIVWMESREKGRSSDRHAEEEFKSFGQSKIYNNKNITSRDVSSLTLDRMASSGIRRLSQANRYLPVCEPIVIVTLLLVHPSSSSCHPFLISCTFLGTAFNISFLLQHSIRH